MSVSYEREHSLYLICEKCGGMYAEEVKQKLQSADFLEAPDGEYYESAFAYLKSTAIKRGWALDSRTAYCKSCIEESKMEP